jgi:putative ATPase
MNRPLAERMRPSTLATYVGQSHLVGEGAVLRSSIGQNKLPSMILWGPPGVGKTTLALLLANELKRPYFALSAINSGVKDVRDTIKKAEQQQFFDSPSPILFIDEIHRFSKSQQDSLLAAVERGTVILIGATTENPSFEVISALLSRCQVYILESLKKEHLISIIDQALSVDTELKNLKIDIQEYEAILKYSGGDARRLLNVLELVISQCDPNDEIIINNQLTDRVVLSDPLRYDKTGDQHYDTISAFIKSIRGSDPNAAVYYLARMIAGGEDPIFICRRLVILASEDIGLANPNALLIANACFDAVKKLGLPEGRIPMSQATIYLATCPKSNSAYMAIDEALAKVKETGNLSIPMHLRNAPTSLMKEIGYGDGYVYTHNQAPTDPDYHYLPKEIQNVIFYNPKLVGAEKKIAESLLPKKEDS